MNIRALLNPLVTFVASELANANERTRKEYYDKVAANNRERARIKAGEIEEHDLDEPEPPMQVIIGNQEEMVNGFTNILQGVLRAAEKYNDREAGVETVPGVRIVRLDPENPGASVMSMGNRSVVSGNLDNLPVLSDAARAELAKQEQEKARLGAQRTANSTGRVVETAQGVFKPAVTDDGDEPMFPETETDTDADGREITTRAQKRRATKAK